MKRNLRHLIKTLEKLKEMYTPTAFYRDIIRIEISGCGIEVNCTPDFLYSITDSYDVQTHREFPKSEWISRTVGNVKFFAIRRKEENEKEVSKDTAS